MIDEQKDFGAKSIRSSGKGRVLLNQYRLIGLLGQASNSIQLKKASETMKKILFPLMLCLQMGLAGYKLGAGQGLIHDSGKKLLTFTSTDSLTLTLSYDRCCVIKDLQIKNQSLLTVDGVFSCLRIGDEQWDSRRLPSTPKVSVQGSTACIGPFQMGPVTETWQLRQSADRVVLDIQRTFSKAARCHETSMPLFHFQRMDDWDGGLLGNGGVAWFKLFDTPQATLGAHVDELTLWNQERNLALRIQAESASPTALRLSRQIDGSLICAFSISSQIASCRYDADTHRRRFLTDRQDIWSDEEIEPSTLSASYHISAVDYQAEYGRGRLQGLDQEAITALLNTVARIGVIDSYLHGSNSWRTPYGPAVLHEQWIALLASAIADDDYIKAYQKTLSFFRDHAIEKSGRVKSRWAYTCEDAIPGTCDSLGFYEAQWGYLMDSNPDFVINVVELFDLCGDLDWLAGMKHACESVLQFMLDRDKDNDRLFEMMTQDHSQARGSDWLDIIWASHENAFINALMYHALTLWADAEELLADGAQAERYRNIAEQLKTSFNQSTTDGGFWDIQNQCYIHWRDRDDSIHGRNMVTPVNFMAIAYGLCDDRQRQQAILDRIEAQTQKEHLFAWPICLDSYEKGEGLDWQFPFPNYENGDIFLGWGQVGVAAYAAYRPEVAVHYVERVLAQYRRDGLAFQRYLRKDQSGAGDDILANNAMTLVGLYRNIYGIQPKHDRLYLDPHLTSQLNGTQLIYRLNGRPYRIDLSMNDYSVSSEGTAVRSHSAFAVRIDSTELRYYQGAKGDFAMQISGVRSRTLEIHVHEWQAGQKMIWSESTTGVTLPLLHTISHLAPNTEYTLLRDGETWRKLKSDANGQIRFVGPQGVQSVLMVVKG